MLVSVRRSKSIWLVLLTQCWQHHILICGNRKRVAAFPMALSRIRLDSSVHALQCFTLQQSQKESTLMIKFLVPFSCVTVFILFTKKKKLFRLNEGHTVYLERHICGRLFGEKFRHFHALGGWGELQNSVSESKRFSKVVRAFKSLVCKLAFLSSNKKARCGNQADTGIIFYFLSFYLFV